MGHQMVKNLPAMQETQVWFLGWENPLEKEMAIHSSILAWRIPWTEKPVAYSPRGRKELDTTERLHLTLTLTFLPRNKRLLISWLQSPSAVIMEPRKIKSATVSTVSRYICHEVIGPDTMILVFWMLRFKPTFSLSSFTFIKRLFSSSPSAIRLVSSAYLRLLIFLLAILIPAYASSSPAFLMMYSA